MMTPAQAGYPLQWAAAKRRRLTSRARNGGGVTLAQVDKEIRRIQRRDADKRVGNKTVAPASVTSAGTVASILSTLELGDSSINRFQGEGIQPTGLTIRYNFDASTLLQTESYGTVRFMVIQWIANGSASALGAGEFLTNVGGAQAPYSAKEWDNRKNFKVLSDSGPIMLQVLTGQVGGNGYAVANTIYVPGNKMSKISFDGDGNVSRGDIVVLVISDSSATPHPLCQYVSQLVYTDV